MRKIPPVITRSETTEEFLARGGQIKKLKPVDAEAQIQKDLEQYERERKRLEKLKDRKGTKSRRKAKKLKKSMAITRAKYTPNKKKLAR